MHPNVKIIYKLIFLVLGIIWILFIIDILPLGWISIFVLVLLTGLFIISYFKPPTADSDGVRFREGF